MLRFHLGMREMTTIVSSRLHCLPLSYLKHVWGHYLLGFHVGFPCMQGQILVVLVLSATYCIIQTFANLDGSASTAISTNLM
jgi:hypothetical protein